MQINALETYQQIENLVNDETNKERRETKQYAMRPRNIRLANEGRKQAARK